MKFWGVKVMLVQRAVIVPLDAESVELFEKVPFQKDVEIEVKQPRNPKFHRLVFALVAKIAKAFDEDPEKVRHSLCCHIGEYTEVTYRLPDGTVHTDRRPNSWKFHEMDEARFRELFERLVKATYVIYGTFPADIRREIDKMLVPRR